MRPSARRKTWADRSAIPSGVWGEIVDGVRIAEDNRATGWEYRRDGIETLLRIRDRNYLDKKVNAVVFGVDDGTRVKYAVFVQDGFLTYVSEDENEGRELRKPKRK